MRRFRTRWRGGALLLWSLVLCTAAAGAVFAAHGPGAAASGSAENLANDHEGLPGSLTIAMPDALRPHAYLDPDGTPRGISVGLWRRWARQRGIEADIRVVPRQEALRMMLLGQVDFIVEALEKGATGGLIAYGKPYASISLYLFVHQSVPGVTSLEGLNGFRVGVASNSPALAWMRRHAPFGVTVIEYADAAEMLNDAFLGEIQAFVGIMGNLSGHLGRLNLGAEFYRVDTPLVRLELRPAVPGDRPGLLQLINRQLEEMPSDLLDGMTAEWAGRPFARLPWKGIGLATMAAVALVLAVLVWNWLLRRRVATATRALQQANAALSGENQERLRAEGKLAALNRRLEVKVRERTAELTQKAEELEAANQRLMELDELKSEFLSSVSHELRTPLTSVRGFGHLVARDLKRHFAHLAESDPSLAPRYQRIQYNLSVMASEGERLTRLINDVLELSRIESGSLAWNDEAIDPRTVFLKAVHMAEGLLLGKREVRLLVDIPTSLPTLTMDPDRLEQVLANLLSNSVKFTEKGMVGLSAWVERGCLITRVEDTGSGISTNEIEHIFDKFHQCRRRALLTDKPQGTGLGLAISKQIVEHYGGEIWVESEPEHGSVFSFTIPLRETGKQHDVEAA